MRKRVTVPLSSVLAMRRPTRAGVMPVYDEAIATADHVHDDPRKPSIEGIGLLDARGERLFRVTIPVKQQMGFYTGGNAWTGVQDEVSMILPEDMIDVSHNGRGLTGEEIDIDDGDDDD